MGVSFYVICHFPLVAFNILSLSLMCVSLITMCLGVFLLGFILPGTLCASWTWLTSWTWLSHVKEVFSYYLFKYFLRSFLSLFSFQDPYTANGVFNVERSLRLTSFLFILFSVFWSLAMISTILSSRSFIHASASVILLWIPSIVYYLSLFVCSLVLLGL